MSEVRLVGLLRAPSGFVYTFVFIVCRISHTENTKSSSVCGRLMM